MRFTQATLLALSSGALLGSLVAGAPVGVGRRGLVATAEVLSCGSTGGGLTVKPGKAGNCPVGWGRPHYDDNICVEIEVKVQHPHSSSHKASSTHHHSTSSAHSTHKASHTSSHKSSSTHHSSSTKHSSHKPSTTSHSHSHSHSSSAHRASPTAAPKNACHPDQHWDALLALCVALDLGDVASLGSGVKIGGPGAGKGQPFASAGVNLDLGDVAAIGGGVKLGGPGGRASSTSHHPSSTAKAGGAKATPVSGACSDGDALLELCVKVGNLVSADATVGGKKGLVDADANVAGIPIKATVAGSDGKLIDANVGSGAVKEVIGGKDGLLSANLGNAVKLSSAPNNGGGKHVTCPEGQILHLGICVKANVSLLGINANAAADVAL